MSDLDSCRRLKICYAYYPKARRKHPMLRLKGHYLSKFGFHVGDTVEIHITQNQITIQKKQVKPHSYE